MADNLLLDATVQFIIGRGGSIRLVGDDQQLAAIGAGGVLRDIQANYGVLRLTQLHRFTDPAEAAATLALRDGRPKAPASTSTGDASTSATPPPPSTPSSTPGRTTAAKASTPSCRPRRQPGQPGAEPTRPEPPPRRHNPEPRNRAGRRQPGERRRPDHHPQQRPQTPYQRNRLGENGDRWTILNLTGSGESRVRHIRMSRTVTLPAGYVSTATELGYASTVHTPAQGATAGTTNCVVTGGESRQQLYTMMTRGRTANHIYLSVVGDGRPTQRHTARHCPPADRRRAARTDLAARRRRAIRHHPSAARPARPHRPAGQPPPATSTPSNSPPNTSPATGGCEPRPERRAPVQRADR